MQDLIQEIEAYAAASGLTVRTVCTYAANDGKLVDRLKKPAASGRERQCLPSTAQKVRDFMRAHPAETLKIHRGRVAK